MAHPSGAGNSRIELRLPIFGGWPTQEIQPVHRVTSRPANAATIWTKQPPAGANFNYRLIFLLGVLAYLVDDINEGVSESVSEGASLRSLPVAILILLLLGKPFRLSLPHEVLDGTVFVIASAWLGNLLLSRRSSRSTALTPSLVSPSP
jgi:hypothetical protein